jgi:parallel beta-helix repeat protein
MTVRVSPDGSGDYTTLGEAVQDAPAGSRILLGAGTYRLDAPLNIGKALSLQGAGMDQTEIVSGGEGYLVRVSGEGPFAAEEITFRHRGEEWADIMVVEGGEVTLTRCRFAGLRGSHLSLEGDTTGTVKECIVEGGSGSVGIFVKDQARPSLEMNTCSNNGYGIRVSDDAQPSLIGNICRDNTFEGIKYDGNAAGVARQNELSGNRTGIAVEERARPTLEENTFTQNSTACIGYYGNSGGVASMNDCSESFGGIGVSDEAQPTLEGNDCSDNFTAGIAYFGNSGGTAWGNRCTGNGVHGIGIFDQAKPTLEENVTTDSGNAGIGYAGTAAGVARGNECSGNAVGILVAETADPVLEDNHCHDNLIENIQDLRH